MLRRATLSIAFCLLAGAFLTGQAGAGDLGWESGVSAHKGGPYVQFGKIHLAVGHKKTLYWRVRSTSDTKRELSFYTSTAPYSGYRVHWYKGQKEITNKVEGSGYDFSLRPHAKRYFRSTVKRVPSSSDQGCVDGDAGDGAHFTIAEIGVNTQCVF